MVSSALSVHEDCTCLRSLVAGASLTKPPKNRSSRADEVEVSDGAPFSVLVAAGFILLGSENGGEKREFLSRARLEVGVVSEQVFVSGCRSPHEVAVNYV